MLVNQCIGGNASFFHGCPQWLVADQWILPFLLIYLLSAAKLRLNILKNVSIMEVRIADSRKYPLNTGIFRNKM